MSAESYEHVQSVTIANALGLHARPSAEFVKLAARFDSEVLVSKEDLEVNGKSIMGVMMLAAERGATILIRARGRDAESAVNALVKLISDGFGED